jgi:hypothetical protein
MMRWITNPIKEGSRKVEKENLGEREWNNPPLQLPPRRYADLKNPTIHCQKAKIITQTVVYQ